MKIYMKDHSEPENMEKINVFINNYNDKKYLSNVNDILIHISNNFDKYRRFIYDYINKNVDKTFYVFFHDKNYSDDKLFDNVNAKIINDYVNASQIENHIVYNFEDFYEIYMLGKFKFNTIFNIICVNIECPLFCNDGKNVITNIENKLNNGFSFIIRAKNEEHTVKLCLESLLCAIENYNNSEIIFVDNNSSDKTYEMASDILNKYKNCITLKYNVEIPKCGQDHKKIASINKKVSLGEYYKWCYSFSNKNYVIKWDCDFLCNIDNTKKMIDHYKLNDSNDSISVWFTGNQIFFYKDKILIDENSYFNYCEPRIHSKFHGFEYENSPDMLWETPYTNYFKNNLKINKSFHFGYPVKYYIKTLNFDIKTKYKLLNEFENIANINEYDKYYPLNESLKSEKMVIFYEMKNVDLLKNKLNEMRLMDSRDEITKKIVLQILQDDFTNLCIDNNLHDLIKKNTTNNFYVINLKKRIDRYENIKVQFKKINIEPFIFEAIEHEKGYIGCAMSHIECLKNAKKRNLEYCVICEDDIDIHFNKNDLKMYIDTFLLDDKLKCMVIIGNIIQKGLTYNDNFMYVDDVQCCLCYCVKNKYYDDFINNFTESICINKDIDQNWKKMQKNNDWIIPLKYNGGQIKSYSNILNKHVNYEKAFFNNK